MGLFKNIHPCALPNFPLLGVHMMHHYLPLTWTKYFPRRWVFALGLTELHPQESAHKSPLKDQSSQMIGDCCPPVNSRRWTTSRRWSIVGWRRFHWGRGSCTWQVRLDHRPRRCGTPGTVPQGRRSSLHQRGNCRMCAEFGKWVVKCTLDVALADKTGLGRLGEDRVINARCPRDWLRWKIFESLQKLIDETMFTSSTNSTMKSSDYCPPSSAATSPTSPVLPSPLYWAAGILSDKTIATKAVTATTTGGNMMNTVTRRSQPAYLQLPWRSLLLEAQDCTGSPRVTAPYIYWSIPGEEF